MSETSYYYIEGGGVTFIDPNDEEAKKHSFRDFDLVLKEPDITVPEPQTNFIEIPFMDGSLDLSAPYGEEYIAFKDRYVNLTFTYTKFRDDFLTKFSELEQFILGKRRKIILDKDPTYFYIGRCIEFSDIEIEGDFATVTVTFQVEPYRYVDCSAQNPWLWDPFNFEIDMAIDTGTYTVDGTLTRIIYTGENDCIPTITVDSNMTLEFNGKTFELEPGTITNYDIRLKGRVKNVLVFKGNGTITIDYKGGRF